jgi:hypothetical protein
MCEALTQISFDNGFRKLKKPGLCFTGFCIIMEMPSDMNGLLKSMTLSRSDVIVIDAIAMSDSRRTNSPTIPSHPPATFGFSEPCFPSLTILISSASLLNKTKKKNRE